jgi:hypothetical protein
VTPLRLALFGLALAASPSPPPAPLVRYEVVESSHAMTPRGERDSALAGTVTVAGERARWDLVAGTFPRSRATAALADRSGFTLFDMKDGIAAAATREDFESLFQPKASEPPSAAPAIRDIVASVRAEGAGGRFEGMPTERWRVELKWTLLVTLPGGIRSVRHATVGTIDTVDVPEARSVFDDLSRLFTSRGEAREAIEAELRKVAGLPVFVSLESTAEPRVEAVASTAAPGTAERPPTTTTSVKRSVSQLVRARLRPQDETLFEVPQGFKARGLERLILEGPSLP